MKKALWALLVLAVIGVVAYSAIPKESGGGGFLQASYTVLNVNQIDYTTSNKMWVILLSQGRGGDVLFGTLSKTLTTDDGDKIPETGELATSTGSAKYPVQITMTPISEQCVYPIKSTSNLDKIIRYSVAYYPQYPMGILSPVNCDPQNAKLTANSNQIFNAILSDCMAKGVSTNPKDYYIGWTYNNGAVASTYPYCIYPAVFGRVGDTNTYVTFQTKIGVKINGQEQSGILTNSNACPVGSTSANCGAAVSIGSYGKAFWYGSLNTGAYCPSFGDQHISAAYLPGEYSISNLGSNNSLQGLLPSMWSTFDVRIRNLIEVANHKTQLNSVLRYTPSSYVSYSLTTTSYKCEPLPSINGNLEAITGGNNPTGVNYNSWFYGQILAKKPFIYNGQNIAKTESVLGSASTTNGVLTVPVTPGTFIYPQYKLEIDGNILPIQSWTVEPQVCKPKIEVISNNVKVLGTGGTQIRLRATNEVGGSSDCVMTASLVCKTGYSAPLPKPLGTFTSGESKEFTMDVSCSVEKSLADSCTITLTGSRGENAQTTLSSTCEPETICTPNTKYCDGNYMVVCNADGTKGKATWCDVCKPLGDSAQCIIVTKETICNDNLDNDGDGQIDCQDTDCSTSPSCSIPPLFDTGVFSAFVAILMAILAFSTIYTYRKKPKNRLKIALIGATIVGAIVFVIFWFANLPISDPLAHAVPSCSCSTCLLPFDVWGCWIKYLICIGAAGLTFYLLFKNLSRSLERLMAISLSAISAIIIYLIALAVYDSVIWVLIAILIILGVFLFFFQVPISGLSGATRAFAGEKLKRKKE